MKGSSPRMRGSRTAHLHSMWRDGIIPAHAGLTRPVAASRRWPGIIPAHAGLTMDSEGEEE